MDRFEAMRAFARVVETGSFTRAAQTLQISRTTATQLVQQLEAHLRLRLLNRTTRRVSVTADGAAYYPRIARLLAELEEVEGGLGDAATQPRGRLRVDVPGPYARLRLVPALPDFQARYPEIQLDIGVSDREVDVIADNVDCVIRGGTPADPALVARPLGALPIGFHASPGYAQRFGLPADPRALEGPDHHMVGFLSPRSGRARAFSAQRVDERVEVQGRYTVGFDDGNAYLAAALAGLGVVALPSYMAEPHVARGELLPVLQDWQLPPMPMHVMFPPNRHMSQRMRVFIDWVVEALG
ncbi:MULTISPECIES: LysR family transcriptional regulator [Stenotrophomonas]|uniref:LysR family transcriptional regulator n=1 Tax=Stenotrophomonas TaxID=40323 RepID=UPI000DB43666|nr:MULTISPECIES: LysR family transcriptional regulator [Stenotrophomonas]MBA0429334.1 LysR family transcriptional regulator [Stenotrophomonas maltophilia]MDH0273874.1 LysR substrate-binding domain-containing protein [Stenotrophomonas sp. GD04089]MDH1910007.1 LysR substrate-binding domain-containing protein [Stenotrophomonas sp. GD03794]PZP79366.1 MAG: LysR family transcriptional regulator [Stenotrophomonas maltophilia]UQA70482.1 LysR family transcriptional regulator [Stenotrophomonas maltophil